MNVSELSEQEQIRRNSMASLRAMGIEPYPAAEYVVTGYSDEIKTHFDDDAPVREVSIAGRIMSRRIMGKASFMELVIREAAYRYTSRVMISALPRTRTYTISYSRSFLISATLSVSPAMCSAPRQARFRYMPSR